MTTNPIVPTPSTIDTQVQKNELVLTPKQLAALKGEIVKVSDEELERELNRVRPYLRMLDDLFLKNYGNYLVFDKYHEKPNA